MTTITYKMHDSEHTYAESIIQMFKSMSEHLDANFTDGSLNIMIPDGVSSDSIFSLGVILGKKLVLSDLNIEV